MSRFGIILLASIVPFGFLFVEYRIIRPEKAKLLTNPEVTASASNQKILLWLKRIGVSGFLFFLVKGLIWVAVFVGLIKSC